MKLLVDAGDMKPNPAISQKIGPLGLNLGKIIQDVNKATSEFKGIKVPVALDIDTKTKTFKVEVSTPPTSELLKKEFGLEKGSGEPNNIKVANAAIEQVISIAKTKQQALLTEDFKKAVKNVLGTCVSLGIRVETKNAKDACKAVDEGADGKSATSTGNPATQTPAENLPGAPTQRGFSLSPKSYAAGDFEGFFTTAFQAGTVITWAGDIK